MPRGRIAPHGGMRSLDALKPFAPGRPHWWQWPTILSLDAPAVALAWQWLLARTAGVTLGWPEAAVLGASVWLAYAADRWIEGWRLVPDRIRTQRHHFYHRARWPLAGLWLLVLALDLVVAATHLTGREFEAGLILIGPVAIYLLSHQLVHRHHPARAPKEACVALLLAGGVAVFIFPQPGADLARLAGPLVLFCLLCFANCALISGWESHVDEAHGQTSLALQSARAHALSRSLPWMLAVVSLVFAFVEHEPIRTAGLCAMVSAVLLGCVDRAEPAIGWELARVLADVALFTPFAPMLIRT